MILITGASGIVGQHLRLMQPEGQQPIYTSRTAVCPRDVALTLRTVSDVFTALDEWKPDVVVNLAGENRPDVVEKDWANTSFINIMVPGTMAQWCRDHGARMIHVSTQGVLGGRRPPYRATVPEQDDQPVNLYGQQKLAAERLVLALEGEVVRLTFILGIRPLPHVARANPLEAMLTQYRQTQVADRFFSPCYAKTAAVELWRLIEGKPTPGQIVHVGTPLEISRAQIAETVADLTGERARYVIDRVKHDDAFPAPQWAPRPLDTTFAADARQGRGFLAGLTDCLRTWRTRLDYADTNDRAIELALFFGRGEAETFRKLTEGFGPAHQEVAKDFQAMGIDNDARLLEWYRQTDSYIWELTAYHLEPGFNYLGMCDGIIQHLATKACRRVLCMGDGVGDLTMRAFGAGLQPVYHDLWRSKTAEFAKFRMRRRFGQELETCLSVDWDPTRMIQTPQGGEPSDTLPIPDASLDAAIALDFFEHLTDVEAWAEAVYRALRPGGLFLAQNAFAIGDMEHGGSIPMHLVRNNRFEHDWDPLLDRLGFSREEGNWRRKL